MAEKEPHPQTDKIILSSGQGGDFALVVDKEKFTETFGVAPEELCQQEKQSPTSSQSSKAKQSRKY